MRTLALALALFISGCVTTQSSALPDCEKLNEQTTIAMVFFMERDAYRKLEREKGFSRTNALYVQNKAGHHIYIPLPRGNTPAANYLNTLCHELRHAQGWRH